MNRLSEAFGIKRVIYSGAVSVIILAASVIHSNAQTYDLGARNTSLQVDVAGGTPGVSDWQINGVNQLNQQWYYYSVGSGTVNSIDTIGTFSTQFENLGNSPFLNQTYSNSAVFVTTDYTLQSQPSGSPQAKLSTLIGIQNESSTSETLHFYIYSDFWLGGISGNQNVQLSPSSPYEVVQTGNGGQMAGTISGISGGTGDSVEEIAGLTDGTQFGLFNGNTAPHFGGPFSAGTGSVDFAYEVDATLAPGAAISFTELESVPEPSPVALIFCGMVAFGLYYGRKFVSVKKVVNRASP